MTREVQSLLSKFKTTWQAPAIMWPIGTYNVFASNLIEDRMLAVSVRDINLQRVFVNTRIISRILDSIQTDGYK